MTATFTLKFSEFDFHPQNLLISKFFGNLFLPWKCEKTEATWPISSERET